MSIKKITDTELSSSPSPDTHFLVTQPETDEAGKIIESLRRIGADDIANMLKAKFGLGDTAKEIASLQKDMDTLNQGGLKLKEDFIGNQVNCWLDDHPEATTTVHNGAIIEEKINANFLPWIKKDYVTPEMFGAVGDGKNDDSQEIQMAINYAVNSAKALILTQKYRITKKYKIEYPITIITKNGEIIYDGADETGYVFTFGDSSKLNTGYDINIKLKHKCIGNNFLDGISGIKLINMMYGKIACDISYFKNGLTFEGVKDCDYNYIEKSSLLSNLNAIVLDCKDGAVNQNTFVGINIRVDSDVYASGKLFNHLLMQRSGSNLINNNTFVGCSFEGFGDNTQLTVIDQYNVFINCRYENVKIKETTYGRGNLFIGGFNIDNIFENIESNVIGTNTILLKVSNPEGLKIRQINSSNFKALSIFSAIGKEIAYIKGNGDAEFGEIKPNNIGIKNSHNLETWIFVSDDIPDVNKTWFGGLYLNSSSSNSSGRALYVKDDSNSWKNILYAYAADDKPDSGISPGYMMFDSKSNKPVWWNGKNWVDAMGELIN